MRRLGQIWTLPAAVAQQTVGWLTRKNKVTFENDGNALCVKLSAVETAAYKKSCKKYSAHAGSRGQSAPIAGCRNAVDTGVRRGAQ